MQFLHLLLLVALFSRSVMTAPEITADVRAAVAVEGNALPSTAVKDGAVPAAVVKDDAVPVPALKDSTAPVGVVKDSVVPAPTVKDSAVPVSTIKESAVPVPTVKDSTVPVVTVKDSVVPAPAVKASAVPVPVVQDSVVPVPVVQDNVVPAVRAVLDVVAQSDDTNSQDTLNKDRQQKADGPASILPIKPSEIVHNQKFSEVIGHFISDLLQIPIVLIRAVSDAISGITGTKPAAFTIPVIPAAGPSTTHTR